MKQIVKQGYYYRGNEEYPRLYIGNIYLLEEKEGVRLVEREYEAIGQPYGKDYMPSPEVYKERMLQKRFLWIWWTIKQYSYMIPSNHWIPAMCFGEEREYKTSWSKVGLWKL